MGSWQISDTGSAAAAANNSLVLPQLTQPPRVAPRFRGIHCRHLAAKSITGFRTLVRGLNAAKTPPALASLGFDLAHLFNGVMRATVVTKLGLVCHAKELIRKTSPIVNRSAAMPIRRRRHTGQHTTEKVPCAASYGDGETRHGRERPLLSLRSIAERLRRSSVHGTHNDW